MTDKEKFRKEVEKLKSQLLRGACSSQITMETMCKEEAYNEVLAILDIIQEEPKQCMYSKDNYTEEDRKVLCEGCEEKCEFNQVKESAILQHKEETCKENGDSLTQEPVNEVWHDAQTERPQAKEKILATNEYGDCEVDFAINMALYWKKVIRWAYIEDLINLSNVQRTVKNNKELANEDLETFAKRESEVFAECEYEIDYYDRNALGKGYYWGCIDGAKWQAEQFEKNRLVACDRQAEEEAEIERDFVMGIIENEHRHPTFDDAIKYGMRLQKEQMMTKSIEAVVSQVPCSNEIIFYNPSSVYEYCLPQEMNKLGLYKGDKVKLIIIKED